MLLPVLMAVPLAENDGNIVRRLQRRDPQAIAEAYDRYGRLAYSLIIRIVRDAAVAEDLTQETFLRVWNRVQGLDAEKGAFGAWLLAIARCRAIDHFRSARGREPNTLELDAIALPSVYTDIGDPMASGYNRPVKTALGKLSPQQREVIELAYFEGLTLEEIAERTGQPRGAVAASLRTAWKNLRGEPDVVTPA